VCAPVTLAVAFTNCCALPNRFKNNKEVILSAGCVAAAEGELITLTLKEAKIEDGGKYRCKAVNKIGSVETDCKLTVEGE